MNSDYLRLHGQLGLSFSQIQFYVNRPFLSLYMLCHSEICRQGIVFMFKYLFTCHICSVHSLTFCEFI